MNYTIRPIETKDNAVVERIIRDCLIEYGGDHAGTAWEDPDLGRFAQLYDQPGWAYWVAEDETGTVVGGVGIGPMPGEDGLCELQKMYCIPQVRGKGVAHALIEPAFAFARTLYNRCYLETFDNMIPAQKFYEKHGFYRVKDPIGNTGHFACEVRYLKDL